MKNTHAVAIGIGIIALTLLIGFGINTAIVWGVCRIMGWAFLGNGLSCLQLFTQF